MDRIDIENEIKNIISQQISISGFNIGHASRFREDLHMDSLDLVELAMRVEEHFGIEVSDEEIEKVHNMEELVNLVYLQKK